MTADRKALVLIGAGSAMFTLTQSINASPVGVRSSAIGVNQLTWITESRYQGEEA
jgi:hypothetical protein